MTLYTEGFQADLTAEREAWHRADREARRRVDAEERPPAPPIVAELLKERLARPPAEVAWRVEGWFPAGGRVVMAAQAKAGKTLTAANLVRSLVDGVPFLGREVVTPLVGRVAVIDFEMTERQIDEWYRALDVAAADRVLVVSMRGKAHGFDLRDDQLRAEWVQLLLEHQVEFVVWDCLRPVLDALGLDENRDATKMLNAFDRLLLEAGRLEALVVHHMGHGNERARGDSGIIGWGDANWKLLLDDDGSERGPRWLSAYGRGVDMFETQLSRDQATGRLLVAGGSRHQARMETAGRVVLELLASATEPMTAGAIEAAAMGLNVSRKNARATLAGLVALNQVVVEMGEKNARLHRLNPVLLASSPVLATPPANTQSLSVRRPIEGGQANTSEHPHPLAASEQQGATDATP